MTVGTNKPNNDEIIIDFFGESAGKGSIQLMQFFEDLVSQIDDLEARVAALETP